MYGAIAGSVSGSRFGLPGGKERGMHLFADSSYLEYNGLMTVAMADAIMNYFDPGCEGFGQGTADLSRRIDELHLRNRVDTGIRKWHWKYPEVKHICSETNMAAGMISPAAWLFDDIEAVRKAAIICADTCFRYENKEYGHESVLQDIRGAEAIASAIFLARTGLMKKEIQQYINTEFGYDSGLLSGSLSLQSTGNIPACGGVPEALAAFFRGKSPEEVITNAVSAGNYGPSSSGIAAMAGGIAAAYYGENWDVFAEGCRKLPDDVLSVLERFDKIKYGRNPQDEIPFSTSFARRRMMQGEESRIAEFYTHSKSVSKTAESFGKTSEEVTEILHKARTYSPYAEKDVISYVNELSPVKLKRGKGQNLTLGCGTGFKEYEMLVLDILNSSDADPWSPEFGKMTGLLPFEIKRIVSKINSHNIMRKHTAQYLAVLCEREEGDK